MKLSSIERLSSPSLNIKTMTGVEFRRAPERPLDELVSTEHWQVLMDRIKWEEQYNPNVTNEYLEYLYQAMIISQLTNHVISVPIAPFESIKANLEHKIDGVSQWDGMKILAHIRQVYGPQMDAISYPIKAEMLEAGNTFASQFFNEALFTQKHVEVMPYFFIAFPETSSQYQLSPYLVPRLLESVQKSNVGLVKDYASIKIIAPEALDDSENYLKNAHQQAMEARFLWLSAPEMSSFVDLVTAVAVLSAKKIEFTTQGMKLQLSQALSVHHSPSLPIRKEVV